MCKSIFKSSLLKKINQILIFHCLTKSSDDFKTLCVAGWQTELFSKLMCCSDVSLKCIQWLHSKKIYCMVSVRRFSVLCNPVTILLQYPRQHFHMHHTFNVLIGCNCINFSPVCTWNTFPPRSRQATSRFLPAVFRWAQCVSHKKKLTFYSSFHSHIRVLLLLFLAAFTPTLLVLASDDSGLLIVFMA